MDAILTVDLLGKFQIRSEAGMLNEDTIRSDMLTKLLVYLITHREHPIAIQELSEALWDEDETDNPAGALKNLMYRLRTLLRKEFGEQAYILTSRGSYSWNNELPILVDAEHFERLCEQAKKAGSVEERINLYESALQIYQGDFIPQITDRHWAVTMSAFYHSLYLTTVKNLSESYLMTENFEKMEQVCVQALQYDSVDEQLYCSLILALTRQNKLTLAMEYYETAEKTLYSALGVRNSTKLKEVHEELLKMQKGKKAEELEDIHEDIVEEKEPEGAYMCGYPVFREIYRLEARKITRLGVAEYIILLTVTVKDAEKSGINEQTQDFLVSQAMNQLENVLVESLRIGDVASRYSDSQFVVLLPACTYECGLLVINRLLDKFQAVCSKRIKVQADLQEVTMSKESFVK